MKTFTQISITDRNIKNIQYVVSFSKVNYCKYILPVVPFPKALSKSSATAMITNTCNKRHINYDALSGNVCRKKMVNHLGDCVLR